MQFFVYAVDNRFTIDPDFQSWYLTTVVSGIEIEGLRVADALQIDIFARSTLPRSSIGESSHHLGIQIKRHCHVKARFFLSHK